MVAQNVMWVSQMKTFAQVNHHGAGFVMLSITENTGKRTLKSFERPSMKGGSTTKRKNSLKLKLGGKGIMRSAWKKSVDIENPNGKKTQNVPENGERTTLKERAKHKLGIAKKIANKQTHEQNLITMSGLVISSSRTNVMLVMSMTQDLKRITRIILNHCPWIGYVLSVINLCIK